MMKKLTALLLALLLCLSLFACNDQTADGGDGQQTENPAPDNPSNPDGPEESDGSQTITEHHYSESLIAALKQKTLQSPSLLTALDGDKAPYMMQNVPFVSQGKVTSITFPVVKTGKTNSNGELVLTLYVVNTKNLSAMKENAVRTISVKVTPDSVGLSANSNQLRWITIDLSSYDIVLTKNQSLGFYKSTNTITPAFASDKSLKELIDADCAGTGFYTNLCANKTPQVSSATMIMDVAVERTYTKEEYAELQAENAAYADMMQTLSQKYAGKYISVLGDSISTYAGVSNNTSYNSTIGQNSVYYHENGVRLSSPDATYWGQLISRLGMKLCVNNGYSSSRVMGASSFNYADCAITRATELDNSNGTATPSDDIKPDVILFYMGTNDLNGSVEFGPVLSMLNGTDEQVAQNLNQWFNQVLARTQNGTDVRIGATYTNFQEAYALTIYRMKQAYPDAEIYCLNMLDNGWGVNKTNNAQVYNRFYKVITEFFGVNLVDLYRNTWIYNVDGQFYTMDQDGSNNIQCHPNALGHAKMAEAILSVMASATQNPPQGSFAPTGGNQGGDQGGNQGGDAGGDPSDSTSQSHFYSQTLINEIKNLISTSPSLFKAYATSSASYALHATSKITNGTVKSISFPVAKTTSPDANGYYTLTLYVCSSSNLNATPSRTVTVKIKGSDFGLSANSTTKKWITVDLSSYNIVLAQGQTLALFCATDTIFPAYADQNTALSSLLQTHCPEGINFYSKITTGSFSTVASGKALILDIEIV